MLEILGTQCSNTTNKIMCERGVSLLRRGFTSNYDTVVTAGGFSTPFCFYRQLLQNFYVHIIIIIIFFFFLLLNLNRDLKSNKGIIRVVVLLILHSYDSEYLTMNYNVK